MLLARRITTNPLTAASRRLSTTTTTLRKIPRPSMLTGFPTAAPAAPSKPLRYADVCPPSTLSSSDFLPPPPRSSRSPTTLDP